VKYWVQDKYTNAAMYDSITTHGPHVHGVVAVGRMVSRGPIARRESLAAGVDPDLQVPLRLGLAAVELAVLDACSRRLRREKREERREERKQ
jgi:hypothetical protein